MLDRLDRRGCSGGDLVADLPRPALAVTGPVDAVREIIADVEARGDAAVREHTERLDGPDLADPRVAPEELDAALGRISPLVREALEEAREAISDYHRSQLTPDIEWERGGVTVRELCRPVERAGCYVPGGRAAYPSTVLMTGIPARVAGVERVVLCVPPAADGGVPDVTLAAARLADVDEVWRVGGAQAIAAMACGTETMTAVDVIVGPGNVYVATAKREVSGRVGVPSAFAGPSEVVVVADGSSPPAFAAIDLAVQAEHGPHGLAWLICWDDAVADAVAAEIGRIVDASPRRDDIEATFSEGGHVVLVDGPDEAVAVANAIAPEHLELLVADPEALLPSVRHAGAVFCGPWSPASVGDYLAGPNHVLPTAGTARYASALRVDDFIKRVHVVTLDRGGLGRVAPYVVALAEAEGLPAHADSVRVRQRER
ncbi:MAG TPA: histidinol dehydrogenase [Acidimicrobiales bacterium]